MTIDPSFSRPPATVVLEEPLMPLTGSPGLVQGTYGDCGNLELVVPDARDGVWVFWCNGDLVEHRSGAPVGRWSSGLFVAAGPGIRTARISQVPSGPDFLELLVVDSAGDLRRHHWSPDHGFRANGLIRSGITDCSALVQSDDGWMCGVAVTVEGVAVLLTSTTDTYPDLHFEAEPIGDQVRTASAGRDGADLLVALTGVRDELTVHRCAGGPRGTRTTITAPGHWRSADIVSSTSDSDWCVIGLDDGGRVVHGRPDGSRTAVAVPAVDAVSAAVSVNRSGAGAQAEIITMTAGRPSHAVVAVADGRVTAEPVEIVSAVWGPSGRTGTLHRR